MYRSPQCAIDNNTGCRCIPFSVSRYSDDFPSNGRLYNIPVSTRFFSRSASTFLDMPVCKKSSNWRTPRNASRSISKVQRSPIISSVCAIEQFMWAKDLCFMNIVMTVNLSSTCCSLSFTLGLYDTCDDLVLLSSRLNGIRGLNDNKPGFTTISVLSPGPVLVPIKPSLQPASKLIAGSIKERNLTAVFIVQYRRPSRFENSKGQYLPCCVLHLALIRWNPYPVSNRIDSFPSEIP